MPLFPRLRGVIDFIRERQLGRKVFDALLAPGRYIPQVTEPGPLGEPVVVREEVVEGRGALRDGTVRLALMGVFGSYVAIKSYAAGGLTGEELASEGWWAAVGTMVTSLGTIWFHIRSWLPVRGSATPTPTA